MQPTVTELKQEELRAYLQELGAHKVGFADLRGEQAALRQYYGEAWLAYPHAISVAVNFPRQVIEEIVDGPTLTYTRYYDALNAALDRISLYAADWLDARGFRAFPIPASQLVGETHLMGIFSHRIAARLAGLGWVGKSCSIITPDRGPRQRFCTILTDAPLSCGSPLAVRCGKCRRCTEICPAEAIKGVNWEAGQPIEERLDAPKCHAFLKRIHRTFGKEVCGRCLAVCPFGDSRPTQKGGVAYDGN